MAETTSKEIQAREKQEVTDAAEQTKPGLLFTPAVDIFETEKELTVIADIPGVSPQNLEIDLRKDTLSIIGDVEAPEGPGESDVLREFRTGRYLRRFTLSEIVDQDKIEASLKNGVLRLKLPKIEKAVPRKITVQPG
ncbi:MAG: Hsp20/alpha crystallin family protein [Desulfobacterales bacterium]